MRAYIPGLAAILLLVACSGGADSEAVSSSAVAASATMAMSAEQTAVFNRSCGLCHGVAGTGAPAPQDTTAWAARNAQGMEALLEHTIKGYGGMPPMGMCMECSHEDFAVFIAYMSGLECEE